MPRDGGTSKQLIEAAALRRRASRVRCLMGGMVSKADYDRRREYVEGLESRAAKLERWDGASWDARYKIGQTSMIRVSLACEPCCR